MTRGMTRERSGGRVEQCSFRNIASFAEQTGISIATLEKLAAADAFRSMGLDRRQALWEVKALSNAPALPLFEYAGASAAGKETAVALPQMALPEHVVNDYQTLKLSLKAHPMQFLRADFSRGDGGSSSGPRRAEATEATQAESQPPAISSSSATRGRARVISCAALRTLKDGARVMVAGVVLVRQRPGSAKGVVFMTIEDETGVANAVVWPKMLERYRKVIMTARLIEIEGRIQRHEDIIHIVSTRLIDRSDWLLSLSEWAAEMKAPLANADEVLHPNTGSACGGAGTDDPRHHPRFAREPKPHHPRNVRIIPKSRDFH